MRYHKALYVMQQILFDFPFDMFYLADLNRQSLNLFEKFHKSN